MPHLVAPHSMRLVTLLGCYGQKPQDAIEEAFGGSQFVGNYTGVVLIEKGKDQIFRLHSALERPLGIELPPCPTCRKNTKCVQKTDTRFVIHCTDSKCQTKAFMSANDSNKYGIFAPSRQNLQNYRWVNAKNTCWDQIKIPWKYGKEMTLLLASNTIDQFGDLFYASEIGQLLIKEREEELSHEKKKKKDKVDDDSMGSVAEDLAKVEETFRNFGITFKFGLKSQRLINELKKRKEN
jgi:hypothetical protein